MLALLLITAPLELWHSTRGAEERTLQALAAQAPDTLVLTQIPFDTLQTKLMQALSVGEGPDIFLAPHERLADWERWLTEAREVEADIDVARAALQKSGVFLGYPFALKTLALVRNAELLPNDVATLEELPSLGLDTTHFYGVSPFFFALTPSLFTQDGALDVHAGLASFAWLRAQTQRGFLPRGFDHTQLVSRFKDGKLPALVDGPWLLADLAGSVRTAVQPLPPFALGTPRPFATVDALFVPKGREAPRALELARWLASPARCAARIQARTLPPYRACVAAIPSNDPLRGFFAALENAIPMPSGRAMGMAWQPLKHVLSTAVSSDRDLAAAAREAEAEFDRLRLEDAPTPKWVDMTLYALLLGALALWARKRTQAPPARSSGIAYLLLAPGALFVTLFLLFPLAAGALLSLFSHDAGSFRYIGFGNFAGLLSSPGFAFTFLVTVLWTITNLGLHLLLGVSLALLLDRPGLRLRWLWRALLILPWAVPSYISALVFHQLFNYELGALNQALVWLGLARVDWFGSFFTAFTANVITNAWLGFPFVMVMTLGALQGIDHGLVEAMRLDGATAWQRFRHLTVPQVTPVMAPAMLLSAMWTFNMFNVIYLVSGGEPRDETNILISEAYRWAFERGARYGYAAAYCVTIFVILWGFVKWRERMERRNA